MFIILVSLLLLYLIKPHIQYSFVRISDEPETILVGNVRFACGSQCPHFYEILNDEIKEDSELYLSIPDDLRNPEAIDFDSRCNNRFIFKGYRYKRKIHNMITRSYIEEPSRRIDLIEWSAITPYCLFFGRDLQLVPIKMYRPLLYQTKHILQDSEIFKSNNYNECCL
ncbi:hypothetical protein BUQ74_00275 [Leptospira weilii serovar Heyan]|uniref:Uncharacterized protein n=1 Tax=Leptospira weilii str. UI 13098 TaxID=1088542 RepID=M6Q5M2_9LEPT|nr:hypothetical protein [Leptospira weilii]EMN88485.1 hypothetical protein LEP1GSC108_2111 [Leptospira weilii str. UI 13098]OMI19248.1 hypothetical protein BUQ74_00275 [Leptospira weilii serovar Heyan]